MTDSPLTLEELCATGWSLDKTKGVSLPDFTSLSFVLERDGRRVTNVQGYGVDRQQALNDAVQQANDWLRRDRHDQLLQRITKLGRHRRLPPVKR